MNNNFNNSVRNATKWSSITEILARLISPITSMILARILTPEAFGIVATIIMVTTFADIFTDAGFQKYLVQHEFRDDQELDQSTTVAFWSNLVISGFLYFLIFIFADYIAVWVGNPGLGNALRIASTIILMTSFSSIQMSRYRRRFDFKTLFKVRMGSSIISLIVTVPFAMWLHSFWALVIGIMASNLYNAAALTILSPWKPKLYYNWELFKEMFSFSAWTLLESISIWLTAYIDTFIVGTILNSYYLGLYKTSMNIVNSFMGIITAALTPVLFSALSRCQHDETLYQKTFFHFQRLVAFWVFPMSVGLFLYRDLATFILLGSQWTKAANFIGLWSLMSGITIIFSHFNSEVFRSLGKPRISLFVQLLHLVVLIPVLIICAYISYDALYIGRSLVRIEAIGVSLLFLYLTCKIPFTRVCKNVFPAICATAGMAIIAIGLQQISKAVWWELISVFICIVAYCILLWVVPPIRKDLLEIGTIRRIAVKCKLKTKGMK